ncbi:mitochondrial proton/calcium exchanger protein-like isoform X2 [Dysidea avara]|uniref:mitochondrial proton/calcium exchanger protein-like isoform X2 n=1 Tax=Dysidea avara TaxID=196820 RepID=UPI0033310E63
MSTLVLRTILCKRCYSILSVRTTVCYRAQHPLPYCYQSVVSFHTSGRLSYSEGGSKSVIEQAVSRLKGKRVAPAVKEDAHIIVEKPPLLQRVWDGVVHTITGFRLFIKDVRLSTRYLVKSLSGQQLSRRERKLFLRTAADIFRMVPFSVFIIIPFMEFLLPVYLFFFPGMLPSSFQRQADKEARKKAQLRMKLQMAQFLQDTIKEMAVSGKNTKGTSLHQFSEFFQQIRTTGTQASTSDIIEFSKLFEDELTLDNLSKEQLRALSKLLLLPPYGSSTILRFQLRMKLRQLEVDDQLIMRDGIDSLTVAELRGASQARGMRALGMSEERLRSQLQQWLELHLNHNVPTSLLLLSRAMYLPEQTDTSEALKATLSTLPEAIVEEAEIKMADLEGEKVDNKARLEALKQQESLIKKEKEELQKEEDIKTVEEESDETLTREDVRNLSQAVEALKIVKEGEKASLKELQHDREEYNEDVADLAKECQISDEVLTESKASIRLGRKVEGIIAQVDSALKSVNVDDVVESEVTITTEELAATLKAITQATDDNKLKRICEVLDEDHDGTISLEELTKVVELIGVEDVGMKSDHVMEIVHLLKKEHSTTHSN